MTFFAVTCGAFSSDARFPFMNRHLAHVVRAAIVIGFAAAAAANAATSANVDQAFGNTIVSSYPDGRTAELWLNADGSYTAEGRRDDPSSGHWKAKGDSLCLKQSRPITAPFSFCVPVPSGGMTQSWAGKAYTGETLRIRLVKGHVAGDAATANASGPQSGGGQAAGGRQPS